MNSNRYDEKRSETFHNKNKLQLQHEKYEGELDCLGYRETNDFFMNIGVNTSYHNRKG